MISWVRQEATKTEFTLIIKSSQLVSNFQLTIVRVTSGFPLIKPTYIKLLKITTTILAFNSATLIAFLRKRY